MGGGLGGDPHPAGLGRPDQLDRAAGGDVAQVQAAAGQLGQEQVAGDHHLLGGGRPAGQPEHGRHLALVHLGAVGQRGVLGVVGDHRVEGPGVLERARAAAGPRGSGGRRRRSSRTAAAERAIAPSSASSLPRWPRVTAPTGNTSTRPTSRPAGGHHLDHPGVVGHRVGVGHRADGGVAAEGGRPRPGLDGLGVLAARLAQVHVQVDQAGADDQPVAVDDLGPGRRPGRARPRRPGRRRPARRPGRRCRRRRVDQPAPLEQQLHASPPPVHRAGDTAGPCGR